MLKQFDIVIVSLGAVINAKILRTEACMIVSPNEMNKHINTIIVAPISATVKKYPTRVYVYLKGYEGEVVLDQLRTINKSQIIECIDIVNTTTKMQISKILVDMFSI